PSAGSRNCFTDDKATSRPTSTPNPTGKDVVRLLWCANHRHVSRDVTVRGPDRRQLAVPEERLDPGSQVHLNTEFNQRVFDRLENVGIPRLGQQPGVWVDEMRFDLPVG